MLKTTTDNNEKMNISKSPNYTSSNNKTLKKNSKSSSSRIYLKKIPLKELKSRRIQKNIENQKSKRLSEINKRRKKNVMYNSNSKLDLKKIPLKTLKSERIQKNIKNQKSRRLNETNKRRIRAVMYKSNKNKYDYKTRNKTKSSSSNSFKSPNISSNKTNTNVNNTNLKSSQIHYIVALHGSTLLNKKVIIPKYNNLPFKIKLYVQKGNILFFRDMEKEAENICNNNEQVSVPKEIMKSDDMVDDMYFENDIPNKFGIYVCYYNSIIKYIPFNIENANLLGLISIIFDMNNKANNGRPFKMSLLSCRGYESTGVNNTGAKELKEQHNEFIEKINPNIELANMMKEVNLFYSLKKWKFTEEQYGTFKPLECGIEKSKQYGCALQTLLFLGELKRTKELQDEIFEASKNKKTTAHKITSILNNSYKSLYDSMLDENYIYKTFPVEIVDTEKYGKFFVSKEILLICKNLKNYEATLIKLNRYNSNVSHVICLLKKDNLCRFIDPQQLNEYSIEDFADFSYNFKLQSFSVLFEKEPDL